VTAANLDKISDFAEQNAEAGLNFEAGIRRRFRLKSSAYEFTPGLRTTRRAPDRNRTCDLWYRKCRRAIPKVGTTLAACSANPPFVPTLRVHRPVLGRGNAHL